MKITKLLGQLQKKQIRIWVEGSKLKYRAPAGTLTPELREAMAQHKAEIIALLQNGEVTARPIPPVDRERPFPLSFAQRRLWFLDQLTPGDPTFNIIEAVRLVGPIDADLLERSLAMIVARHESLRTTFERAGDEPVQVIDTAVSFCLRRIDLREEAPSVRESGWQQVLDLEAEHSFSLAEGPLFRASLIQLAADESLLVLNMHHIISDGWSMALLSSELSQIYAAYQVGEEPELPPLPIQYADYTVWQMGEAAEAEMERQLAYWREQLAGAPPLLELPTDWKRPSRQTTRGAIQKLTIPSELAQELRQLSQQTGATLFMTLLTAYKILLWRHSGQTDVAVGTPIAGRNRPEIESLIGFFLNSLVLRTDLSDAPSFRALLGQVRETALAAYAHQDVPFERLLEELQPERAMSYTPLFQVFFNMQTTEAEPLRLGTAVVIESVSPSTIQSKFDITIYAQDDGHELHFSAVYNVDLFTAERMQAMMAQYEQLLHQIVAEPEQTIDAYTLVTEEAAARLPDPEAPQGREWYGPIHSQLTAQAARSPEKTAVLDAQDQWAYQALEQHSNQLAHYLREQGIERGDVVAVYAHRSASLVWAVMGIHKAGAAFLLLDRAYPPQRLAAYVSLAQPRALIAMTAAGDVPEELSAAVTEGGGTMTLELPRLETAVSRQFLAECPTGPPEVEVGPDDLAYISFTSGSTGKPKGILGRHGSLSHFLPWQKEAFRLTASDRFSMLSGLSHDPLQRDMFTALWVGGTICIPQPERYSEPGYLANWLAEAGVTFAHLTPPMAQLITETAVSGVELPVLRYAFFVGDKLTHTDVRRLRRLAPAVTCINSYGATETQRAVSYNPIPPQATAPGTATYPVGRGMPDVQVLVLTSRGQLCGVGEVGEIYMRSPHLALGYLGDKALTRERFLVNPFTGAAGDRLYRTGDLGRYLPDGQVTFAGRADRQVKIRGFRIELGEVEAALAAQPGIQHAIVTTRDNERSGSQLVAYVVPAEERPFDAAELRLSLGDRLPDYMIPAAFVPLSEFPLTPNGKIDYARLPAPDMVQVSSDNGFVPPQDGLEHRLVNIWEQVLGVQRIGVTDNYFDLGGHSLQTVALFSQIEKAFDATIPLGILFQAPTVRQLAAFMRQQGSAPSWPSLVPIAPAGHKPPFFCVHGGAGHVMHYRRLAEHLGGDQPFYGIQPRNWNEHRVPVPQVEELAAQYLAEVQRLQPQGPYYLGGFCFGGPVAYEMAQQLKAAGEEVAVLALIEPTSTWAYVDSGAEDLSPASVVSAPAGRSLISRHRDNLGQLRSGEKVTYLWNSFYGRLRRIYYETVRKLFGLYLASERPIPYRYRDYYLMRFVSRNALMAYRPVPYDGRFLMFVVNRGQFVEPSLGWQRLAGAGVELHTYEADHTGILGEPYAKDVAAKIRAAIDASLA